MHNSKQEKLGVRPLELCFILHSLLPVSLYFFQLASCTSYPFLRSALSLQD